MQSERHHRRQVDLIGCRRDLARAQDSGRGLEEGSGVGVGVGEGSGVGVGSGSGTGFSWTHLLHGDLPASSACCSVMAVGLFMPEHVEL